MNPILTSLMTVAENKMSMIELVGAIMLILSCVLIIVIVFFQGSQKGGMSQSITGQSSDNYYQRNMGRSKEMKLKKATTGLAITFFGVAIAVNVIAAHFGEDKDAPPPAPPHIDFPLGPEPDTTTDAPEVTDAPTDTSAPEGTDAPTDTSAPAES
jgi:protein translocase SecG subunit